jgi:hypothetical protein
VHGGEAVPGQPHQRIAVSLDRQPLNDKAYPRFLPYTVGVRTQRGARPRLVPGPVFKTGDAMPQTPYRIRSYGMSLHS